MMLLFYHLLEIDIISQEDKMKGDSKMEEIWIAQDMTSKGLYIKLKCIYTHAQAHRYKQLSERSQ